MRITYLNPTGQLGGAEVSLLDVLTGIRRARPDWDLSLLAGSDGPLVEKAAARGVDARVLPFPPALRRLGDAGAGGPAGRHLGPLRLAHNLLYAAPSVLGYARKLRAVLSERPPDLIHTNGFKMHLLGACARPRSVPVLWHIHDYVSERPLMRRLIAPLAPRCQAIVANSRSVAQNLQTLGLPASKIHPVWNAVDLHRFSPAGEKLDLNRLSGLPPAPPEIVRVGLLTTLARWKGHQTFLKALALLPPDAPVRAYIIGGPLYETEGSQFALDELKEIAAGLGLSERVGFTGYVAEPASAMRALDIVVHASTRPEPFGLVIAEAMACGRPVLVSNAGGAAEIAQAARGAVPYPPADEKRLAERLAELAASPELRQTLGRAGRESAQELFPISRLAERLVPLYQSVARHQEPCVSSTSTAGTSTAA